MLEVLKDNLGAYHINFSMRINQYQIMVVHEDTGEKIEQWLPPDHFTEGKVTAVIEYCIETLRKNINVRLNGF